MAKISLPKATEPFGTCPHCGAKVLIAKTWLQKLNEIITAVNASTANGETSE